MDNKEYVKECFDLIENRYNGVETCVSCGRPLSAEGSLHCWKCQQNLKQKNVYLFTRINGVPKTKADTEFFKKSFIGGKP
jgi:predicted amidophosphoribosyltransferase